VLASDSLSPTLSLIFLQIDLVSDRVVALIFLQIDLVSDRVMAVMVAEALLVVVVESRHHL
jgi:hypothetical protein